MNRLPELSYSRLTNAGKILDIVFPQPDQRLLPTGVSANRWRPGRGRAA